ncbi:MAG: hypothetical protein Q9178_001421 [Gyalolechia marmorata]
MNIDIVSQRLVCLARCRACPTRDASHLAVFAIAVVHPLPNLDPWLLGSKVLNVSTFRSWPATVKSGRSEGRQAHMTPTEGSVMAQMPPLTRFPVVYRSESSLILSSVKSSDQGRKIAYM